MQHGTDPHATPQTNWIMSSLLSTTAFTAGHIIRSSSLFACMRTRKNRSPEMRSRIDWTIQNQRIVAPDLSEYPVLRFLIRTRPPNLGECRLAVFRHQSGMVESVPPRSPNLAVGPLRDNIVIPEQYAIERPRRGNEVAAVSGEHKAPNQCVDRWVFYADEIAGTGHLSLTLAKISTRSAVARHAEHRIVLDDLMGAFEHELHAPEVAERRPATLGV